MAAALAPRGPDGMETWCEGPIGLVHAMLRATPESEREVPLPRDDAAGLVLAWDGRLDNREEVAAAAAAAAGRPPRGDSDADLVLAACAAFGEEAPERLLGDFAFALWDAPRRRLLLARDAVGLRPLFYAATPRAVLFGSGIGVPLEDPSFPPRPCEGWIAEWLALAVTGEGETIYEGLRRIPAAHLLVAAEGRLALRRFWEPRPDPSVPGEDEAGGRERLLSLLSEAVRCRLRSRSTAGIDLSGGLDSSAVAALAGDLERKGRSPAPGLLAQSVVYPGLECDETPWIRASARSAGIPAREYPGADPGIEAFEGHALRHRHLPDNPASVSFLPMLEDARREGIRVRLGGEGGDERFGGDPCRLADLLRSGRLGEARAALREESGGRGIGGSFAVLWAGGLRPLLPSPARSLLRGVRGRPAPPPWIRADFARRSRLADRVRSEPARGAWPTFEQAALRGALSTGAVALALEDWDRQAADFGLEARHPFLDRRIVEWSLSLPRERRIRGALSKVLLRDALSGLLPGETTGRTTKTEFTALHDRALRRMGGAGRFERLAVEEAGWVDGAWTREAARRTLSPRGGGGPPDRRTVNVLWSVFALDLWYRMTFAREGRI